MKDHASFHNGMYSEGWGKGGSSMSLILCSPSQWSETYVFSLIRLQRHKEAERAVLLFFIGAGGIFYYTCLSSCPLFISLQLLRALFSSPFSYLTEGCRIRQSGWWSSNSIYSAAQRQAERARAIWSGMGTTDVREHFLLAAERWGGLMKSCCRAVTSGSIVAGDICECAGEVIFNLNSNVFEKPNSDDQYQRMSHESFLHLFHYHLYIILFIYSKYILYIVICVDLRPIHSKGNAIYLCISKWTGH